MTDLRYIRISEKTNETRERAPPQSHGRAGRSSPAALADGLAGEDVLGVLILDHGHGRGTGARRGAAASARTAGVVL